MQNLLHRTMPLPPVHVLEDEYERLADVVCASPRGTEAIALLWSELSRAQIIPPAQAPPDLVRMNSRVRYTDLFARKAGTARLVYEGEDDDPGDVLITSPLGAALIGLRPGATFSWLSDQGLRAIRVDSVEQGSSTFAAEVAAMRFADRQGWRREIGAAA